MQYLPRSGCLLQKMETLGDEIRTTGNEKGRQYLAKHLEGLLNFTLFPITNAVAEGFNSKIQSLRADAKGFRNALNYRTRILFHCGRLNLFPSTHEIP